MSVTYGEKNGWLAAPLFEWKIQRGELVILDVDGKIFQTFRLVARDSQTLKVRNKAGKTLVFKRLNAYKPDQPTSLRSAAVLERWATK